MKGLSKFFDTRRFLEGKRLEVVGVSKWNDFETKQQLGTKVNTVIAEDHTVYPIVSRGLMRSETAARIYGTTIGSIRGTV